MIQACIIYNKECPELYAAEIFLRNRGYKIEKIQNTNKNVLLVNEMFGGPKNEISIKVGNKTYSSINELHLADSNGEIPRLLSERRRNESF